MGFTIQPPGTPLERIVHALGSHVVKRDGSQIQARCPAHDDRKPSLSVTETDNGKVLVHCHAGCETSDVVAAVGLSMEDLLPLTSRASSNRRTGSRGNKPYDYTDADGKLLYQIVRTDPKGFFQRRPDGNRGWINNMKGIQRVLYRLPGLLNSDPEDWVYVVEGEKDADRLTELGLVATTSPGGAGKWSKVDNSPIHGRKVAILPDNDDAGKKHANQIALSLWGNAEEIRVIELPDLPDDGDVSDFLDAGGSLEQLDVVVESSPLWQPTGESKANASATETPSIGEPFSREQAAAVRALASERLAERVRNDGAVTELLSHHVLGESGEFGLLDSDPRLPEQVQWWPDAGYRIVFPLYDKAGDLSNVLGLAQDPEKDPRDRVPKGSRISGHVIANRTGLELFRGGAKPTPVLFVDGLLEFLELSAVAPESCLFAVPRFALASQAVGPWAEGMSVICVSDTLDEQSIMAVARKVAEHGGTTFHLRRVDPSDCLIDCLCDALKNESPEGFFTKATAGETSYGLSVERVGLPPKIVQNHRQLDDVLEDVWRAILRANAPPRFFCRSQSLVELRCDDGPAELYHYGPDGYGFLPQLAKVADWMVITEKYLVDAAPRMSIVKSMIARPDERLPRVDSIARAPFFTADGELVVTPGFHEPSRVILDGHGLPEVGVVPMKPTPEQVEEAVKFIEEELLCDFPFVSRADEAHTFAALLQPFVRLMIDGPTPVYLIEAPTPGSGKGLIAQVVSLIASGVGMVVQTLPTREEEVEKRITAILKESPSIVVLDNANRKIDSSSLCAAITTEDFSGRELGYSRMLKLKNHAEWFLTANNPETSMEVARRTARIRIDAKVEEPWMRHDFRHTNLPRWARHNRGVLIRCLLVIVQNWIATGRPAGPHTSPGSFESWGETMDGILTAAGIPGFLENRESVHSSVGTDCDEWLPFLSAWWDRYGRTAVPVGALGDLCEQSPFLEGLIRADTEKGRVSKLGRQLIGMRDRVIGGYRIELAGGNRHKGRAYRLERLESPEGGLRGDFEGTSRTEKSPSLSVNSADAYGHDGGMGDVESTPRSEECGADWDDNPDADDGGGQLRGGGAHGEAGAKEVPHIPHGCTSHCQDEISDGGLLRFRSPQEVLPKSPDASREGMSDRRDIVSGDG